MIACVFPGQGAQKEGMGKDFYDSFPSIASLYDAYPYIRDVCFFNQDNGLASTELTQQAILLTSVAIGQEIMKHFNISAVAGLSLGEYSALVCAQALTIHDAMPLIQKRGQLMSDALKNYDTGMMAVISDQLDLIETIIHEANTIGVCTLANYNAPAQFVISGDKDALTFAKTKLNEAGIRRVISLNVAGAFHSSYLHDASHALKQACEEVTWCAASMDVIMNVDAKAHHDDFIPYLTKQIYSSVKWMQSLKQLETMGMTTIIEIGPSSTLSSMITSTCPTIRHLRVSDATSLHTLIKEGL